MSITDELRESMSHCISDGWLTITKSAFEAVTDRIDAEHERQCAESWMRGHDAWAAIDRSDEMAEHGWIRLPKDADGEYIHVGDVLTDGEYTFRVDELAAFGDGSWSIRNEGGNAWAACDVTHHHTPTVEDVLRDMHAKLDEVTALYVGEAIDSDERDSDEARIFAEYAAKLRLAGDGE